MNRWLWFYSMVHSAACHHDSRCDVAPLGLLFFSSLHEVFGAAVAWVNLFALFAMLWPWTRAIGPSWNTNRRGQYIVLQTLRELGCTSYVSRLEYVVCVIVLSSRGRKGGLVVSGRAYWAGVAGSPCDMALVVAGSTPMVVTQPVALETSPAAIGES